MNSFVRYSIIKEKFPREFLLLQGTGCIWKKCVFCDYHNDKSLNPFKINKKVLDNLTGITGVIDIINSGSAMELDDKTISLIKKKSIELNIHTIWFESHYIYKNKLKKFAEKFYPVNIKFRIGIESFNSNLRNEWKKGIPSKITAKEISKYFNGCCLLVGIKGQKKEDILNDITLANKYFEYFSINVFVENTTNVKQDKIIIGWFLKFVVPKIKFNPKIEILLNNKDLGVG